MTEIKWESLSERKLVEKITKVVLSFETAEIAYHKMSTGNYFLNANVDGSRLGTFNFNEEEWKKFLDLYQILCETKEEN